MLKSRLLHLKCVLNTLTGENGEPNSRKPAEKYILKSMWLMLLSEFEGSIKDLAEGYIDKLKTGKINDMHICFLVQNFHGDIDSSLSVNQIINLYKKNKTDIAYTNFTKNKTVRQKSFSVERLFNTLGIFFSDAEKTQLKLLDGISSTRDAIAHGDHGISITRKELEDAIIIVQNIFKLLKSRVAK